MNVYQLVLALVHGNVRFNCSIVCGHYRHMFWPKHSRQLLFRQWTWLRYKAVYRLRSSCLNITFELHNLIFSSISFQILTKLWFGSLDENVVRGLVLNIWWWCRVVMVQYRPSTTRLVIRRIGCNAVDRASRFFCRHGGICWNNGK